MQEAMRRAEASGNDDCPVKIKLVAPLLSYFGRVDTSKIHGLFSKVYQFLLDDLSIIINIHL